MYLSHRDSIKYYKEPKATIITPFLFKRKSFNCYTPTGQRDLLQRQKYKFVYPKPIHNSLRLLDKHILEKPYNTAPFMSLSVDGILIKLNIWT